MEPTESARPRFSAEEAEALILELWKIKGAATELPSERDQNFRILSGGGAGYILKIANTREKREVLELQALATRHLARNVRAYNWPEVIKTSAGEDIAVAASRTGTRHFVRLLTFLPGVFLSQTRPHSTDLLRSLGVFLGALDAGFATFEHPAADRPLKWNMKFAPSTIRERLRFIPDSAGRELVEHFLRRHEELIVPRLPLLRTSIIHNDANDNNVLVDRASPDPEALDLGVTGIIDFGDMVAGFPALELAIGSTYAALGKVNPLAAMSLIVAGYNQVFPLTEAEVGCLYDFVAIRLCLSVAISAEQRRAEPANEYLSISERPAWALLDKWRRIEPDFAHYVFRGACGLSPCPQGEEIISWLRRHRDEFSPVVGKELEKERALVFDLSVDSPDLASWTDREDMTALSALLLGQMAAVGATWGLGRYNEARPFYSSGIFKTEGNDSPEWRTVHLGLDVHLEPGANVSAPLDGTVHSFADNSGRLNYGPTIILEHATGTGGRFYTLYGHLSKESLEGLIQGRSFRKGDRVGTVGSSRENGGWPPHLHFQIILDLLGKSGDFPGVAPPSQRDVWLSLSPDPGLILKIPEGALQPKRKTRPKAETLGIRRQRLGPNLSLSYKRPLKIVRGFRQFLYDENGQAFLDATNNVPHVGHCHPKVVRAAQQQTAVLNTNTRYLHDNIVEYALRLKARLPEPLGVFFFVCSGSEANDLALRLARTHTRRRGTIVVDGAYHGNLTSLIEISPFKFDGPGGEGAPPHVRKVATPDVYRGVYKKRDAGAGAKYGRLVEVALQEIAEEGWPPAAFICEALPSSAGVIELPPGYLREAFRHVRKSGAVCIADEVQVGFGRLGTHFWGFETQDVVPDIVTLGKPIGNGHPLAAVVTTPEIAASFKTGMEYFNTFGGNPVSCAVGLAVLEVLEEEGLQSKALAIGRSLRAGLEGLMERHRLIGDVRGSGLFVGVELVRDHETLEPASAEAEYVAERLKDKGILISTEGPRRNVLKIRPPMVIEAKDAVRLIETLDMVLAETPLKKPDSY